ncbi:MAG: recombinase family protein [Nanoarchaeota archaeon]
MKPGVIKTIAVGYIRISTNEDKQKYGLDVQRRAIKEYCKRKKLELLKIFCDEKSGKSLERPGLQELLKEKDLFQVLVVYKIDRLSRSLFELLRLLKQDLSGKEVVFIQEGIDQRTKEGRLLLHQLASFAEYERELISSRIKEALAEAKKKGNILGRKPEFQKYIKRVIEKRKNNLTWKQICAEIGINFRTAKKCYEMGLQKSEV